MSKSYTKENALRYLKSIMEPKCERCSDTGVVPGPTFNGNDPTTYEDFTFCGCEVGMKYRIESERHEDTNTH